jgi:hypothetical protein
MRSSVISDAAIPGFLISIGFLTPEYALSPRKHHSGGFASPQGHSPFSSH